jgi:Ca2+-binding RTX toxin-like protein
MRRSAVAFVPILLLAAVFASPAAAAISCNYTLATHTMAVTTSSADDPVAIQRVGNAIHTSPQGGGGTACGAATVTNTDTITVDPAAGTANSVVFVILSGGPFAPGFTTSALAANEIEIEADLGAGTGDILVVSGGSGNESWAFGDEAGNPAGNLNAGAGAFPDGDVDLTTAGVEKVIALGRDGNDTISGLGGGAFDSSLGLGFQELNGGQGNDHLSGSNAADTILDDEGGGSSGADTISAGGGSDQIFNAGGNDQLGGGVGLDTVFYYSASAPLRVDLAAAGPQATGIGSQTISAVENAVGSAHDDTLIGGSASNELIGGNGNDTLIGRGGDDALTGNGGRDTASYAIPPVGVTQGVTVSLADPTPQDTVGAGTDTLGGIEDLTGSPFGDFLTGNSGPNTIRIRDAVSDSAACGGGADTVTADLPGVDTIAADCETRAFDVRPDALITSGPTGATRDATPTFAFASTKPGSLACALDAAAFGACTAPRTLGPLADGPHTFRVGATDLLGNADLSPAARTFTVDTRRPSLTRVRAGRRLVRLTLSEAATVKVTFARAGKGRRFKRVGAVSARLKAGTRTIRIRGKLARKLRKKGSYRATLVASDAAGNKSKAVKKRFRVR